MSAESALAATSTLALEELKGETLIGITRCEHEDAVAAELAGYGVDVASFERYDDNRLIQSLVASGSGVAIVPSLIVDANDDTVRVLEIPVDLPPRTIALVHPRDAQLSQAALRFKQRAVPLSAALLRRATAVAA